MECLGKLTDWRKPDVVICGLTPQQSQPSTLDRTLLTTVAKKFLA